VDTARGRRSRRARCARPAGAPTNSACIAGTRRRGAAVYSPDEIDYFFVVDGELTCYFIPLRVVGGYQEIHLRRYAAFIVGTARFDAHPATQSA
jgi:hypothetical protein